MIYDNINILVKNINIMIYTEEFKRLMYDRYEYLTSKAIVFSRIIMILNTISRDIEEEYRERHSETIKNIIEQNLRQFRSVESDFISSLNGEESLQVNEIIIDNYIDDIKKHLNDREGCIRIYEIFTEKYHLLLEEVQNCHAISRYNEEDDLEIEITIYDSDDSE